MRHPGGPPDRRNRQNAVSMEGEFVAVSDRPVRPDRTDRPDRPARLRAPWSHITAGITAAGLLTSGVGGFLPWVRSGTVSRDSFELAGVLDRHGQEVNALLSVVLSVWIVVPLGCALCIAAYLLGRPRPAAVLSIMISLIAGTVGVLADVVGDGVSGTVVAVSAGPVTTAAGSGIALLGALGILLATWRRPPSATGALPSGTPANRPT